MDFLMAIQIRAKLKPKGFANASKTSFFSKGGPVSIPQKQREKISQYGLKLIQSFCRLQILKLANFSIKKQGL